MLLQGNDRNRSHCHCCKQEKGSTRQRPTRIGNRGAGEYLTFGIRSRSRSRHLVLVDTYGQKRVGYADALYRMLRIFMLL